MLSESSSSLITSTSEIGIDYLVFGCSLVTGPATGSFPRYAAISEPGLKVGLSAFDGELLVASMGP